MVLTKLSINNEMSKPPVLIHTEGYLSKARIYFDEVAHLEKACEQLRYFEVFEGSGRWSYGLAYGQYIRPSEYDNISD